MADTNYYERLAATDFNHTSEKVIELAKVEELHRIADALEKLAGCVGDSQWNGKPALNIDAEEVAYQIGQYLAPHSPAG